MFSTAMLSIIGLAVVMLTNLFILNGMDNTSEGEHIVGLGIGKILGVYWVGRSPMHGGLGIVVLGHVIGFTYNLYWGNPKFWMFNRIQN